MMGLCFLEEIMVSIIFNSWFSNAGRLVALVYEVGVIEGASSQTSEKNTGNGPLSFKVKAMVLFDPVKMDCVTDLYYVLDKHNSLFQA